MTSYLSSLLWGTSQLDDAVGVFSSLPIVTAPRTLTVFPRQGDV